MPTIKHNEITFPLPAAWEDGTQVIALGPVDSGFRPNVVVSKESARSETIEKFAARQLAILKQQLGGFALVKEGPAKFGAHAGFLREYTFAMQGHKLGQLQFYVLRGSTAYAVTYTHLAPRLAATRKVAEDAFARLGLE